MFGLTWVHCRLIQQCLEYAKRAVAADEKDFAAQKWLGIAMSRSGDFKVCSMLCFYCLLSSLTQAPSVILLPQATSEKIKDAFVIREQFEKACALNPKDATSWHLLVRTRVRV